MRDFLFSVYRQHSQLKNILMVCSGSNILTSDTFVNVCPTVGTQCNKKKKKKIV